MSDRPDDPRPSPEAAGGWFVPKQAMSKKEIDASQQSTPNDAPMPGEAPQQPGSWYVPPEGKERAAAYMPQASADAGDQQSAGQHRPASAHQPQSRPPKAATAQAASGARAAKAAAVTLDEFGQPVTPQQAAPVDQFGSPDNAVQSDDSGLAVDTGQPVATPAAPQPAAPTSSTAVQADEGGMALDTGQPAATPAAPQPAQAAQSAPLPAGAAVVSDQIDYSNYVPGRGFVARQEQDTSAANSADNAIQPLAADDMAQGDQQPVAASAQDPASVYTPTGDTGTQASQSIPVDQPIPAGSPADNDAAALEAESAANANKEAEAEGSPSGKPATPELIHRFEDVEKSVHTLRRKYNAGTLSRAQLQDDLRKLMILDQDGYWWMIGLESDRWYKYNGKDWIPAVRPGKSADDLPSAPSAPGSAALARASSQALNPGTPGTGSAAALDEFGLPLPQRVPIVDPGATMVGMAAPRLDNTLKAPAVQQPGSSASSEPAGSPRYLQRASSAGVPDFDGGMTMPSGGAQLTQPNRPIIVGAGRTPAMAGAGAIALPSVPVGTSPRLRAGDQPDYGAPPAGFLADRQRAAGCIIRLAIAALFLSLIGGLVGIILLVVGYYSIIQQYDSRIGGLAQAVQAAPQSARILDARGQQLVQLNDPNYGAHSYVPLNKVSPYMITATIRVEDQRFYDNPGFDVIGIARAIIQNLRAGGGVSGASSITQQLARALVLDPGAAADRSSGRKIVEIIVSSEIARRYTKSQIMEFYLNTVNYGNLSYGVQAAAQNYFAVDAKDLDVAQSAFLAGLVQAPATYNPAINKSASLSRFDEVLGLLAQGICVQMEHAPYNTGQFCIGKTDMDAAAVLIAKVKQKMSNFHPTTTNARFPHFVNYVTSLLEKQFGSDALYSGGFTVYTTIDPGIQQIAEQAVQQQISSLKGRNVTNGAVIAVRPQDGAIMAMVGSVDFNNKDFGQFNVVTDGQRQPGSSIKPFVYLTSFERDANGSYFTPSTIIWDVPSCFGSNNYCPPNYDLKFHGPISVRTALSNSINVAAVKALQYDSVDRFKALATRVGLTFPKTQPEQAGLAAALGGVEVTMLDMAQGYSVLANNGAKVPLYAITKVTRGANNDVVFEAKDHPAQQVVEPGLAYLITNILSDNQARQMEFGNGLTLSDGRLAAVKTGTTNDFKDNWTIGYTPQLVVATWVGNNDGTPMIGTTGLTGAAPIWKQVMVQALAGQPKVQFPAPPTVQQMTVCADFGTQDFQGCANRRPDVYFQPNPPPPANNIFQQLTIDSFSGLIANQYCPDYQEQHVFLTVTDPTAIAWLNNDPDGQAWAKAHNLTLPVVPPPTQSCDANTPRPTLRLTQPQPNAQVQGILEVRGSVSVPGFNRYQLEAGQGLNATNFQIVDGPYGAQPTGDNSFLGRWDTTNIPNGPYTLRLWAVDGQGRHVQQTVPLYITNGAPGTAPTATPFFVPTVTPQNFGQPGQNVQPTQFVVTATPIVINPQGPTQPPATLPPPTVPPALPPTNTLRPIFPPTSTP